MYDERMGQIHFWLMFIGQNVTFFPMHFTGLNGMPRRIYTYYGGMGWDFWNLVSTLGAVMLAIGFLFFIYNMWRSWTKGELAGADPWDGRTLEWSIPSPPPEYNFAEIPNVQDRDDWWEEKQRRRERTTTDVPVVAGGSDEEDEHDIHLPQPSYWPFFVSLGLFIAGFSLVYLMNVDAAGIRSLNWAALTFTVVGVVIGMVSVYRWSFEPVNDPEPVGAHAAHY
jgi:cytochrome c oxidase subunit 1